MHFETLLLSYVAFNNETRVFFRDRKVQNLSLLIFTRFNVLDISRSFRCASANLNKKNLQFVQL